MSELTDDEQKAAISAWIEQHLGPVVHIEREGRWRPSWLAEALVDGRPTPLYVRGGRGGSWPPLPLSYEAEVFKVFERNGIRVPHVHGYLDTIPAIIMDRVAGIPGLDNAPEGQRDSLRDQLMEQMSLINRIDPAQLVAIGAPTDDDVAELGVAYYRRVEALFVNGRDFAAPGVEFARRWINRHVPKNPEGPRTAAVDAAQFIHHDGKVTAMLDFEQAGVGDFHSDLAALRIRNRLEYIDDVDNLLARYARMTGEPLDYNRIRYHTALVAILTPMMTARELYHPRPEIDFGEYRIWNAFCMRLTFEALGEMLGHPFERFVQPHGHAGRYAKSFEALNLTLASQPGDSEFEAYAKRKKRIAVRFLERCDRFLPELEARFRNDIHHLTGIRPETAEEADRVIEDFVVVAGPEHDTALINLFHRFYQGECFLLTDEEDVVNQNQLVTPLQPISGC